MSQINPATARLAALLSGTLGPDYPQLPTPLGPNGVPLGTPVVQPPPLGPRRMSPQEEAGYFLLPVFTAWTPSKTAWTPTIGNDPRRLAVIWSTTGNCFITTDPSQTINQSGIALNNTSAPLVITESLFGPLPSLPWFASVTAVPTSPILFSCEILLREWPQGGL